MPPTVASTPETSEANLLVDRFLGRRRRLITHLVLWTGAVIVALHVAGGWYFSNQIRAGALEPVPPPELEYRIEVLAVDGDTVTLSTNSGTDVDAPGTHGVVWPEGHGIVRRILATSGEDVVREFELVSGALSPGTLVDLDVFVYQGDPATALDLAFEPVTFDGPLGSLNGWHVPADGDGWVIFVHGKSGPLRQALRLVTALHDAGMHVLVINYRNDVDAPADPSGFYRQGLTEWEDLAAAVTYAQSQGADDVAIIGSSMGGAIATSFLRESPIATAVAAVVLDAPMLDFGAAVDHQADNVSVVGLGVPWSLRIVATTLSDWRFGVDWNRLDYTDQADGYETPMLIFHGTEDDSVPIEPSRRLAELRPDLVELIETPGARHVGSWNIAPEAYESRLVAFLEASFE